MRLIAENLGYRYAGVEARQILDAVSLEVGAGESVAIIGPSGSGKTTLLALLGGLLAPQSGSVSIRADDGSEYPVAANVAWVLQTINLLPDRTLLENVRLGAFASGIGEPMATRRARTCVERVQLGSMPDKPARQLSGGEMQRVVIARAMASSSPVVLADEPTGQLDASTTDVVLNALLATHSGRVVVIVTHDPSVARRCDRAYRLTDGVLLQEAL